MTLSPIQEEIVNTSGNLIVSASAGTGKTRTMVEKIARDITKNHSHKVVAAITFTIKAAAEIKDRLLVDTMGSFIGTNNSFIIEEIIKPFMKDVFGQDFNMDFSTDYSQKVLTFEDGIKHIKLDSILCSYEDNKKNFIFDLAQEIIEKSTACKLFLKAKYFKLYIDEYQDCDKAMHKLFMYMCDELHIDTFIVGDEKQSIYMWRGAYPEAFRSIWRKDSFTKIFMGDNYRSCKQIQNYSNLLYEETRSLYNESNDLSRIVWVRPSRFNWVLTVMNHINLEKTTALLRYSKANAQTGATALTAAGMECTYIPPTPISNISTDSAWLYTAVAKFAILKQYSVYDFISEIPAEGSTEREKIGIIKKILDQIVITTKRNDNIGFGMKIQELCHLLGYVTKQEYIDYLYDTITKTEFHVAFQPEKYKHVAITFHSSKGLEFDQVIVFAEDYPLATQDSVCNHYVAVTRAKDKLMIVQTSNNNSKLFQDNLSSLFNQSGLCIDQVVSFQ